MLPPDFGTPTTQQAAQDQLIALETLRADRVKTIDARAS
jgi:hypothetical protein